MGRTVTVDLNLGEQPTNGADVIYGTPGDDVIDAIGGNDYVCGNGGNDTIRGGPGNDRIYGGAGDDQVWGNDGVDVLFGQSGNDMVYGGASRDYLYGYSGSDVLEGGAGNDRLYGQTGMDYLDGGEGNDYLHGGSSADWCVGETERYCDDGNAHIRTIGLNLGAVPVGGLVLEVTYNPEEALVTTCESMDFCQVIEPGVLRLAMVEPQGRAGIQTFGTISFYGPSSSALAPPTVVEATTSEGNRHPLDPTEEHASRFVVEQNVPASEVRGDVTCDGRLTVADALMIARFEVGEIQGGASCNLPNRIDITWADFNGNGVPNVVDALVIARCRAGWLSPFCDAGLHCPTNSTISRSGAAFWNKLQIQMNGAGARSTDSNGIPRAYQFELRHQRLDFATGIEIPLPGPADWPVVDRMTVGEFGNAGAVSLTANDVVPWATSGYLVSVSDPAGEYPTQHCELVHAITPRDELPAATEEVCARFEFSGDPDTVGCIHYYSRAETDLEIMGPVLESQSIDTGVLSGAGFCFIAGLVPIIGPGFAVSCALSDVQAAREEARARSVMIVADRDFDRWCLVRSFEEKSVGRALTLSPYIEVAERVAASNEFWDQIQTYHPTCDAATYNSPPREFNAWIDAVICPSQPSAVFRDDRGRVTHEC